MKIIPIFGGDGKLIESITMYRHVEYFHPIHHGLRRVLRETPRRMMVARHDHGSGIDDYIVSILDVDAESPSGEHILHGLDILAVDHGLFPEYQPLVDTISEHECRPDI